MLEFHRFLFKSHESLINLFANLSKVLNHSLQFGNNLGLGLLKEDSIDEAPAFSFVFQVDNLLKYESIGGKNEVR